MKYFICELDNIFLGIASEQIQRIIPVSGLRVNVLETENEDAFISIPALFCQKGNAIHGLILKKSLSGLPGKTTLLTPGIDMDIELPEDNISRLPGVFTGIFSLFKGACFTEDGNKMILILDLEKLTDKLASAVCLKH